MFSFQPKPDRRTSFEDLFFDHYSRLLEWALQLTHRDRPEAEDLVQELYIRVARLGSIPERIENAENYLFSVLRNLHYTRARRARTGAVDSLSIVDYDSVQHGLRAIDRNDLLSIRSDLYRICDYLCRRKNSSRAASIFILRYFLGYFPNELTKVVQSSRAAVDKAVQAVRREARLDLERPGAIRSIGDIEKPRTLDGAENEEHLFIGLRTRIFATCAGECFGLSNLKSKYEQPGLSFTTQELAHLVSCTTCLDQANRILGLPLLEDRSPDDTIGRDTPQGPSSSAGPTPTLVSSRPSRKRNELERRRMQLKRSVEEVDQHRPERLLIVVDGDARASQKVTARLSELRVELGREEKPSFIEVLSEQGYCLAFVPVQQPVPDSDLYQSQETSLSDDRSLRIVVSFTQETPSIQVVYSDPLLSTEENPADLLTETQPATALYRTMPTLAALERTQAPTWPERFRSRISNISFLKMNPLLVSAMLFGLCSIACFLLWTRSGPRISPRTFLSRAEHSDAMELASSNEGVIYQKVRISMPGHAMERAIYRDPARKRKPKPQHLDGPEQKLKNSLELAGVNWNDPLSAANYAEWHDQQGVRQDVVATTGNNLLTLTTSSETDSPVLKESLTVRMSDFHPVERTIELRDEGTVEIAELNYDVMPWGAVNQGWFEPLAGGVSGSADIHPSLYLPHVLSDLELDEAELEARVVLNQLHADTGEQIHVSRSPAGIQVKGVVDTDQRKAQIMAQLLQVPHVHASLLSVEEISNEAQPDLPQTGEPIRAYSIESQPSPLEQYMREKKLPIEHLAAISQSLLDGCLKIQQAQGHLSELQSRFGEENQLPDDIQMQLSKLSANYAGAIQTGLDADRNTLISLDLAAGSQSMPTTSSGATAHDLVQQVRLYQSLCQEMIASGADQPRSAQAIANDLIMVGAQIRMRIPPTLPTSASAAHN